jgi:tetratricopeptide (TPR) repeat protein
MALARRGQHEDAINLLQRAVRRITSLSPSTLQQQESLASFAFLAGQQLANILSSAGRYEEAIETILGLAKLAPEEEDALERQAALVKAQDGRLDEAHAELAALAERYPDDPQHWMALARVEFSLGRYAEAESAILRSAEVGGSEDHQAVAHYSLFLLRVEQNQVQAAITEWEAFAALSPEGAADYASAFYDLLLRAGETSMLRRYLDADAAVARREYYRGLVANRAGDFAEGRRHWEAALEADPLKAEVGQLQWAEAALRLGKTGEALALLVSGADELRSARGLLLLAIAMVRTGQVSMAAPALRTGANMLRSGAPRRERYTVADWELFTSLVDKRELWDEFRQFFSQPGEMAQPSAPGE